MNSNGTNPLWGSYLKDNATAMQRDGGSVDDVPPGAYPMNFDSSELGLMDLLGTFNCENNDIKMGVQSQISRNSLNPNIILESPVVKGEISQGDLEHTFTNCSRALGFCIEESEKLRNKPYKVDNGCIIGKRNEAMKIKALGARGSHIIKMSMRYKADKHYQQPVMTCALHKIAEELNQGCSFRVVPKTPVNYILENGHPTAIINVGDQDGGFYFSPIFLCRNSCHQSFGKDQEMILRVCDIMTHEVLHEDKFDVRICENVGRDSRMYGKKGAKRLKKSTGKKPRQQVRSKAQGCEALEGVAMAQASAVVDSSSVRKTRHFMVELNEELLVFCLPLLETLAKVGGGKEVIEINPAFISGY